MNLAEFTIRKKTLSLVLIIVLLVGGAVAFMDMPRLEDPEFTIKEALVVTNYPGATPAEVANEVTDTIENAVQKMSQLKRVTSTNSPGLSIVNVEIKDQYDKDTLPQVWDELRRKINDAQAQLPPGAGPSLVIDDFGDVYGILFAVTSEDYSQRDLQNFTDYLRKQLLLLDDVAKIIIWGKQQETVFIEISRSRMSQLGLSLGSIYQTLSQRNLVVASGNVRVGREYIEISPTGNIESLENLGDLYIKNMEGGELVPLRDIANIHRGYADPPSQIMRYNGNNATAIGISMVPTGNVVDFGRALDARLEKLKNETPVGMHINRIYYQPERVEKAVNSFVFSLATAVIIVIMVLILFMGWQSGLLIGAILLITICGSFIFIQLAGVALERISLGALIIALGMLVDNAIVVVEGLLIRYQKGMNRLQAAGEVVNRNKWPLLGGTIIAIMAFAGIGLSNDAVGEYCNSLFIVLFISLSMSWITAVTVTPLLCHLFLHPKITNGNNLYEGRIFETYKNLLTLCLKHRNFTMYTLVGLLTLSILGFGLLKQNFFPDSSLPSFYIHYWMPQGTDIRATSKDMAEIEAQILKDKRVHSVSSFTGQGAPRFILTYAPEKTNTSYGMLLVEVKKYEFVEETMAHYKAMIEKNYPDAEAKLKKFRLGPGRNASIEVRFSGTDTTILRELSAKAQRIMRETKNAESIRDNWRQEVKIIRPIISEAQAKLAGITRSGIAQAIEMSFSGTPIGVYREKDELLPIVARLPKNERLAVDQIENMQVFSPVAKQMIPMEEIVPGFKTNMEFGLLKTRNRILTVTASCEPITGLPLVLQDRLMPLMKDLVLPEGYTLEWGGEFEDSTDAQRSLIKSQPLPFFIMILVTIMLFNGIRIPLIIWLTVPLSVIGVTFGLLATGQPFGFMALLGFLSLSGMLIKNSIVLLDQLRLELSQGTAPYQAIISAALSRIRPVGMAASTTILGLVPLVADSFFSAMAVTIISGLAFATLLTLLVVPVLYALFYKVESP